jgi:hypothetical protein
MRKLTRKEKTKMFRADYYLAYQAFIAGEWVEVLGIFLLLLLFLSVVYLTTKLGGGDKK